MKTNAKRLNATKKEKRAARANEMIANLQGVPMLGEIVIPNSKTGTIVDYELVKKALSSAGLDPSVANEILPKRAFSRACRHMEQEKQIDVFSEDDSTITFQFTRKELAKSEWKFTKEVFLTLDKSSGKITCENHDLEARAQEMLNKEISSRTTSDITKIIHRLFDQKGENEKELFPLRDQGGVYFVPLEVSSFLAQIDLFFTKIEGSLRRFPIPSGTPSGDRAIQESVADSISRMLGDHKKNIQDFSIHTRSDTIEHAALRIKETRLKIKAYAHYLKEEAERLDKECIATDQALLAQVKQIQVEKESSPAKKEGEGKRDLFFGHPVTSVIRWMGANGLSFEEAEKSLKHHGISVAAGTIRTQLLCGRKGTRGEPASLSKAQIKEVLAAARP